ncbi:hypothetical protein LX99_02307 [Mucilaginibacter oryzae]|uniref:SmpA/OmlA family protein n=1 Tax=Mucilaginibacter oryzae TaxID=468058 RepID=A0A316HE73_9SPHI|nr:hypothetical protein [Mucilaginibacter oryzae]PWK78463.1 hypothetical protein LX99_02307 [Mucilaginibacter oryzae]
MKRLFFIIILLSVITGCDALKKNYGIPYYQLGMSEQDFTLSHKNNLTMMEAVKGQTVYRRVTSTTSYTYYYFENSKLVRMLRTDITNPNPVVVVAPTK